MHGGMHGGRKGGRQVSTQAIIGIQRQVGRQIENHRQTDGLADRHFLHRV
jgi:hypothetical protein